MDLNTILLIAFAMIMLFCCGGLRRLFSRRGSDGDHCSHRREMSGDAPTTAAAESKNAGHGGCCR